MKLPCKAYMKNEKIGPCRPELIWDFRIFDVHTLGKYGHIHTKYEVSMSNPLAGRCAQVTMRPTMTMHDGQSRIV